MHFVRARGHLRLGSIRRREIGAYRASKREAGLKPGTINNQLGVVSKLLKVVADWSSSTEAPRGGVLKDPRPDFTGLACRFAERSRAASSGH